MKKILVAFAFAASLSACHYGTNEAQKTIETNELYKTEQAGYSINRANVSAEAPVAPADTALVVVAPAAEAAPAKPAAH